ncbi:Hypothetical protein NG00_00951 [Corynebacterium camporealensis]|uniref:Uncharacterized protein n=1 Tax=Corynebacterium camporealensis TaxID=161896 RepID=A0A0F6QWK6_9CORY|nr:hypothetical protein [Corynebacterium camporealensis]AKE39015.1 hypothetical protein UL81_05215 [Corynebacterium camporealensis]AVH88248.1 Hypothetical protein NG00_00951 [Corynebacterium camporealensis]
MDEVNEALRFHQDVQARSQKEVRRPRWLVALIATVFTVLVVLTTFQLSTGWLLLWIIGFGLFAIGVGVYESRRMKSRPALRQDPRDGDPKFSRRYVAALAVMFWPMVAGIITDFADPVWLIAVIAVLCFVHTYWAFGSDALLGRA